MDTELDQCRCFSLIHKPSLSRSIPTESGHCYETAQTIQLTSYNSKLSHFIIHPNNNIICAFNVSSREVYVFPSPETAFYTFRPALLSFLEDMLFVGNSLFLLSRNSLLARYMLSIYSLDGEGISFVKWRSMIGEGFFLKIDCSCCPAEGRMAVTEGVERLIVESNLSNKLLRNSTVRFYSDECTGFKYSVRHLTQLTVAIHLQIVNGIIYEYITHEDNIVCYTCELHHFLPEEDLPVANRILSVRTDLISPFVYSINCIGQHLLTSVIQIIDTVTYSLSIGTINLVNGAKSIEIPVIAKLNEEPLHNAIKCDFARIVPIGILQLSDGSVRTFWNLERVAFIQNSKS